MLIASTDPIDPSFYRLSRSPSSATIPTARSASGQEEGAVQLEPGQAVEPEPEPEAPREDEDTSRKRTIAERMAKLGGIQ